jgi:ribosomal protein S18 acetylase RimI-like enzyme
MEMDLSQTEFRIKKPMGITVHAWSEEDFSAAGPLIASAYAGHLDSLINDQYRSLAGALRFLHNIVRFPGCGLFDQGASFIAIKNENTEPVGLILCSKVSEQVGHVTQLCVAQSARHYGVGSALLQACSLNLARRGFEALTLTVTEGNKNAVALYRRFGFKVSHEFDAMVWERGV